MAPGTSRTSGRRAAIVSAATELFATKGYAGTGIDEIGARVGISGPAIYRHFAGKDALLAAVLMDTVAAFTVPDAAAGHEQLVAEAVGAALDDPTRLVTYVRERHRLAGPAREELARAERRLHRPWRAAIRAANPELGTGAVAARHWGVLTAMSTVVSGSPAVARSRLRPLLAGSMSAVLTVPPIDAAPGGDRAGEPSPPPGRRERILTEALRLFRQHGYHGVGMDAIGEAAGISGPTIYFHYESKAHILADAFERAGERVAAAAHDAEAGAASAADALDRLAGSYLEIACDGGDLILVTSREASALAGADRLRFTRLRSDVLGTWAATLRRLRPDLDDGAARAVATGALALLDQMAYTLGHPQEGVPLARAWCLGPPPT